MIKGAIAVCVALTFSGAASAQTIEQKMRRLVDPLPKPVIPQVPPPVGLYDQPVEQRLHQATEAWTNGTGEYVPALVRQVYFRGISNQIFTVVSDEIARNPLYHQGTRNPNLHGKDTDYFSRLDSTSQAVASLTEAVTGNLTTVQTVGLWLQKFPTIRVIVQPTPPKEFLLTINGEPCPATEKAMYRVPAGAVTVRVWRQGSALCEKTYNTTAGAVYDVECAF